MWLVQTEQTDYLLIPWEPSLLTISSKNVEDLIVHNSNAFELVWKSIMTVSCQLSCGSCFPGSIETSSCLIWGAAFSEKGFSQGESYIPIIYFASVTVFVNCTLHLEMSCRLRRKSAKTQECFSTDYPETSCSPCWQYYATPYLAQCAKNHLFSSWLWTGHGAWLKIFAFHAVPETKSRANNCSNEGIIQCQVILLSFGGNFKEFHKLVWLRPS